MNDNTKLALALTVPAIGLFAGAMMLRGPGSSSLSGARRKKGRPFRLGESKPLSELTASEINRRLDRLDKAQSKLTDEFIEAGRGNELPSETVKKTDPLALRYIKQFDERSALSAEVARRYGPGAPRRLPTRRR